MDIKKANRLFEFRRKHNLSQEELAEKIGVSRQAVSKWERGETSPDTDNLISLSQIYCVTIDELLFGENIPNVEADIEIDEKNQESEKRDRVNRSDYCKCDCCDELDSEDKYQKLNALVGTIVSALALILFFICGQTGIISYAWSWIFFLATPIVSSLMIAIQKKNPKCFAYPVLVLVVYMILGAIYGTWGTMWLLFLTTPLYYAVVNIFVKDNNKTKN